MLHSSTQTLLTRLPFAPRRQLLSTTSVLGGSVNALGDRTTPLHTRRRSPSLRSICPKPAADAMGHTLACLRLGSLLVVATSEAHQPHFRRRNLLCYGFDSAQVARYPSGHSSSHSLCTTDTSRNQLPLFSYHYALPLRILIVSHVLLSSCSSYPSIHFAPHLLCIYGAMIAVQVSVAVSSGTFASYVYVCPLACRLPLPCCFSALPHLCPTDDRVVERVSSSPTRLPSSSQRTNQDCSNGCRCNYCISIILTLYLDPTYS